MLYKCHASCRVVFCGKEIFADFMVKTIGPEFILAVLPHGTYNPHRLFPWSFVVCNAVLTKMSRQLGM